MRKIYLQRGCEVWIYFLCYLLLYKLSQR